MRTRTTLTTTAVILLALTGCSSDQKPDIAACKTAMTKQVDQAMAAGEEAVDGKRPASCDGVDDKTLERLAGEITKDKTAEFFGDTPEDTTEDVAGQPSVDCRAWIETELISSGTIDAASGADVCGDLTDAQLDQAIEDVTNDLAP
ncbi:hypothetical protein RB201_35595 [Streptomyces sp. S1A(2023)]